MDISYSEIVRFFQEIYNLIKKSSRKLEEPWFLIKNIECLKKFNSYELEDFLLSFSFIKRELWNHISINKIKFIIESLKVLNYDITKLSKILDYQGFEQLIKEILKLDGYNVITNYRFSDHSYYKYKTSQERYEIDVMGLKENFLLIIDAKQWNKRDLFSSLNKAANLQFRRIIALHNNEEKLNNLVIKLFKSNNNVKKYLPLKLIPMIITLEESSFKTNNSRIPLVSIYKFNSFLQELKENIQYFKYIEIKKVILQKRLINKN